MRQKTTNRKIITKVEDPSPFWDHEIEVGEVLYGDSAKHIFSICIKNNKKYISMSRWYWSKKAKAWILTNKGTTLRYEEFSNILDKLQESFERAKRLEREEAFSSEQL